MVADVLSAVGRGARVPGLVRCWLWVLVVVIAVGVFSPQVEASLTVEFQKVAGHAGHPMNERADQLAVGAIPR